MTPSMTCSRRIHDLIVDDNEKSGIRPSFSALPDASPMPQGGRRQAYLNSPRPLSMPDPPESYNVRQQPNGEHRRAQVYLPPRPSSQQSRRRPPVHPKPEKMQGSSSRPTNSNLSSNSMSPKLLAERFANLRVPSTNPPKALPYPTDGGIMDVPASEQSYARPHLDQDTALSKTHSAPGFYDGRPSGPRPMPPPPSHVPPPPPKLPLDTDFAVSLPRAPSPTYSPARNIQSPSSVVPPRSTARSMITSGTRSSQLVNGTPFYNPVTGESSYTTEGTRQNAVKVVKPKFQGLPNPTAISAEELFDTLRLCNVLLIDVRSREEFDEGHILSASILCIEPLSLKYGISSEDLEDRLVLSPEGEQLLFCNRDDFDLVVYYDSKTSSNRFLEGSPSNSAAPALRNLYDTLYEFSYEKPLQRPPAVLLGGLEAWTDLLGPQALQTSQTATSNAAARPRRLNKSGRVVGRMSLGSANSSREIRKRRLREYNPLNDDEERAWREKARKEEVEATEYQQAQSDGDGESVSTHPDEPVSPLVHSYEDFLRKFPEPSAIQESMVGIRPGLPPSRPAPILPSIPSRPPPAVPRPSYSGVSERDSSQLSPNSRAPLSAQPPLYTGRSITHYLKLPRTGLINFSVTCYMNATIQCLLATLPLSQFFLDNRWRNFVQKNWKGSNGIMPEIYANLIRSMWRNDVQAVRPSSLRNFCTRLNKEWGIDRQQDAKEFFDFLIDCLHEDLNVHWERHPLRPLTADEEFRRECMPINLVSKTEWDRYSHREASFISSLFAGQHASRLRCKTCGNTSTTYEAFYSISIEIPRSGRGDMRDCLRSYCAEEMLAGDEVWKCPSCRCEREATKRISITRLPQVLVIHFKRFSASKTESARKVHTPIDFPLHGLNMEPYMTDTRLEPASDGSVDQAITPPFQYDAYAVMRHLGQTGNGGHYISLVRDAARGCWRKFDDEKATDFDPNKLRSDQRLQNEQAYIVFYGRSAAR